MNNPLTKKDCERALLLLEKWNKDIENSGDESTKESLDELTKVFQSQLFGAIIDIQLYYEEILRDVHKCEEQVKREAEILAKKWKQSRQ